VTVNETVITNNAGNNDDGDAVADGSLITVGGFDDPFSPLLPSYQEDHERYDIAPYIDNGDLTIAVHTINPSSDDNIYIAGFYVNGLAAVNKPPQPPQTVPVPTLSAWGMMLLIGLFGLIGYRRRFN
jgi:hypothetical protein